MAKKKQKTKAIPIAIALLAVALASSIAIALRLVPNQAQPFHLDSEYYTQGQLKPINSDEFNQLIANKKSFVVMAHMLLCPAEAPLTTTVEQFIADNQITIYELTEEDFKQTALHNTVTYLPTAAIYHEGRLIAWLDAESDTDLPAYKNPQNFKAWLSKHISLNP